MPSKTLQALKTAVEIDNANGHKRIQAKLLSDFLAEELLDSFKDERDYCLRVRAPKPVPLKDGTERFQITVNVSYWVADWDTAAIGELVYARGLEADAEVDEDGNPLDVVYATKGVKKFERDVTGAWRRIKPPE